MGRLTHPRPAGAHPAPFPIASPPMTTTQHTQSIATTGYSAQHARAMDLLMRLQSAVCDCPAPDSGTTITWGHVGSLGELNRQLDNALAFIEGNDA